MNLIEAVEEQRERKMKFTQGAYEEMKVLCDAVRETVELALKAFVDNDLEAAAMVEPLEQVVDEIKEEMRTRHILRLQQGECSIEAGFVWTDLLNDLERTSDHCSNIAGCVIDVHNHNMNIHESLRELREDDPEFRQQLRRFGKKYRLG